MAEGLALGAALLFGLVHFFSGLMSRQGDVDSYAIALFGQFGGAVLILTGALALPALGVDRPVLTASEVDLASLGWGLLSGVGSGVGVACLYRGLASGQMSVVVPLSDVAGVALPVLVGVAVLGDRPHPLAWLGIAAALPALWLVSRDGGGRAGGGAASGARYGLLAGVGFAVQFLAISRVDPAAGLWPVLAARAGAVATVVPMALAAGASLRPPWRLVLPALVTGSAGSVAIVLYQLATLDQLVALATVLASLYPAIPVVLAIVFLHERPTRVRLAGLACTAVAIALIALG